MGTLHSPLIDRASVSDASPASEVGDQLAQTHFTLQSEKPPELADVEVAALDPLLRVLLFTDGTVTRTLEAQTLAPVKVEPMDEVKLELAEPAARQLWLHAGSPCLRRRVRMSVAGHREVVWAESLLIGERLPAGFVEDLDGASHGIGSSLAQTGLESSRELLCFGLTAAPRWASAGSADGLTLSRRYRISIGGLPALLITETFAIELRAGLYCFIAAPL